MHALIPSRMGEDADKLEFMGGMGFKVLESLLNNTPEKRFNLNFLDYKSKEFNNDFFN